MAKREKKERDINAICSKLCRESARSDLEPLDLILIGRWKHRNRGSI